MLGLPVPRINLQSGCHLYNGVGEMSACSIPVLDRYKEWVDIDRAYTVLSQEGQSVMICTRGKICCLAYRSHVYLHFGCNVYSGVGAAYCVATRIR